VFVPLYLHHRYQVEAAASVVGGQDYSYTLRGDGRPPAGWAPAAQQRASLDALHATLSPAELSVPDPVLKALPPRPDGFDPHRELFPRYTGQVFDAITPAVVAADHTLAALLHAERAARLVEQHAIDPALPGLDDVLDRLVEHAGSVAVASAYEEQIKLALQRVVAERLMALAATARMPQVRALATNKLVMLASSGFMHPRAMDVRATSAADALLVQEVKRFLERPLPPATPTTSPAAPPGAPIGEPAMEWIRRMEPGCSMTGRLGG
jgi:hypothetical protein